MFSLRQTVIILILIAKICACNIFPSLLQVLVTRGTDKKRDRSNAFSDLFFDEYGDSQAMTNVYREIERAATVIAIRSNNATLVCYVTAGRPLLQIPLISSPFVSLSNPWQKMLLTGVAGDCRKVVRETNKVIANHLAEFAMPPSADHLTSEIGRFLRSSIATGKRPYACHSFVIDPRLVRDGKLSSTIFEVDAAGGVQQVWAGIAGKEMRKGKKFLEDNYKIGMSTEEAMRLAEGVFDIIKSSALSRSDESDNPNLVDEPDNLYLVEALLYLEHFIVHDTLSK